MIFAKKMRLDKNITKIGNKTEQLPILWYLLKWTVIGAVAGALIGSASALLLESLNWATDYRENNLWIIALLPLGGLAIGLMYHYLACSEVLPDVKVQVCKWEEL